MCRLWLGVTYIKLVLIGPLANHKCLRDPCLSNWLCRQQKGSIGSTRTTAARRQPSTAAAAQLFNDLLGKLSCTQCHCAKGMAEIAGQNARTTGLCWTCWACKADC